MQTRANIAGLDHKPAKRYTLIQWFSTNADNTKFYIQTYICLIHVDTY